MGYLNMKLILGAVILENVSTNVMEMGNVTISKILNRELTNTNNSLSAYVIKILWERSWNLRVKEIGIVFVSAI